MRRTVPSFTVEVRRRPRLATNTSQGVQLLETKSRPAAFERESHRLAAATFEVKTSNQPSSDGAASYPTRRSESLVPETLPVCRLQGELLSAAPSNPKSRARKPPLPRGRKDKGQTSKAPRTAEISSDLTGQMEESPSVASNLANAMSPSDATTGSSGIATATANRVGGNSGDPAPFPNAKPHPKAKRRVQIPKALDARPAPVSAKDQQSITQTDSLGAPKTRVDDALRPNRKRTIIGRYVFGDEPKPGERWKRRLSKGR